MSSPPFALMTVTYSDRILTATRLGAFSQLLFMWKGSVYKLVYVDLLAYLFLYFSISCVYRFALDDRNKRYHSLRVKANKDKTIQSFAAALKKPPCFATTIAPSYHSHLYWLFTSVMWCHDGGLNGTPYLGPMAWPSKSTATVEDL